MKLIKIIFLVFLFVSFISILYFATDVAGFNFIPKTYAQTESPSEINKLIPAPIKDLFQEFSKISDSKLFKNIPQIKLNNLNDSQETISWIFNKISYIFNSIDNWLENNVGLSLVKIVKLTGNLFIWLLEGLTKLLSLGLKALP